MSATGKSGETESRLVVARGWWKGDEERLLMGTGFPFWVTKMFWNLIEVTFAQHRECTSITDYTI